MLKKLLLTMFLSILTWEVALSATAPELFEATPLADALRKASVEKKLVMIDFFTTWCGPCKMLDQSTWKDAGVISWVHERAIAIRVDCDQDKATAEKYRIRAYPTIVFVKADGKEAGRLVGYMDSKAFLSSAADLLAGKTASMRAQEKLKGGHENDPMLRQQYGRALAEEGSYPAALKEFLWCFDHGLEYEQAYAGVRLSYLVSDIMGMSADYPAARQALVDRRQALEKALAAPAASLSQAYDFAVLSDALEQHAKTLPVYDSLRVQKGVSQEVLSVLYANVFGDLLQARRYEDIIHGADPQKMIDNQFSRFAEMKQYFEKQPANGQMAEAAKYVVNKQKQDALELAGGVYEALLGAHQDAAAQKAAASILKFDASPSTYQSLAQHAERAGNAAAAKAWRDGKTP